MRRFYRVLNAACRRAWRNADNPTRIRLRGMAYEAWRAMKAGRTAEARAILAEIRSMAGVRA